MGIFRPLIYLPVLHKTDEWLTIRGALLNAAKEDSAREEGEEDRLTEKIKQVKENCGDTQWTGARAVLVGLVL